MEQLTIAESLSGLGSFIACFGAGAALLAFFCRVYGWVTPYPEFLVIGEGKLALSIPMAVLSLAAGILNAACMSY